MISHSAGLEYRDWGWCETKVVSEKSSTGFPGHLSFLQSLQSSLRAGALVHLHLDSFLLLCLIGTPDVCVAQNNHCILTELYSVYQNCASETEKSLKCRKEMPGDLHPQKQQKPKAYYLNHLCCIYFSHYRDKTPEKSHLRKGSFVLPQSLMVWSIMAGKAWQKDHEANGHDASVVKNRERCHSWDQEAPSPVPQPMGQSYPHQVQSSHFSGNCLTEVCLLEIKLAMEISCHSLW